MPASSVWVFLGQRQALGYRRSFQQTTFNDQPLFYHRAPSSGTICFIRQQNGFNCGGSGVGVFEGKWPGVCRTKPEIPNTFEPKFLCFREPRIRYVCLPPRPTTLQHQPFCIPHFIRFLATSYFLAFLSFLLCTFLVYVWFCLFVDCVYPLIQPCSRLLAVHSFRTLLVSPSSSSHVWYLWLWMDPGRGAGVDGVEESDLLELDSFLWSEGE